MAQRRVEVGEKVRIRHGLHKGKMGVVKGHERYESPIVTGILSCYPGEQKKILLTYVVEIEGVGPRRVPGSYLDLVE